MRVSPSDVDFSINRDQRRGVARAQKAIRMAVESMCGKPALVLYVILGVALGVYVITADAAVPRATANADYIRQKIYDLEHGGFKSIERRSEELAGALKRLQLIDQMYTKLGRPRYGKRGSARNAESDGNAFGNLPHQPTPMVDGAADFAPSSEAVPSDNGNDEQLTMIRSPQNGAANLHAPSASSSSSSTGQPAEIPVVVGIPFEMFPSLSRVSVGRERERYFHTGALPPSMSPSAGDVQRFAAFNDGGPSFPTAGAADDDVGTDPFEILGNSLSRGQRWEEDGEKPAFDGPRQAADNLQAITAPSFLASKSALTALGQKAVDNYFNEVFAAGRKPLGFIERHYARNIVEPASNPQQRQPRP